MLCGVPASQLVLFQVQQLFPHLALATVIEDLCSVELTIENVLCGVPASQLVLFQVQQLFPHLALATVIEDLRSTRSVELTIENVLDGRVVPPPPMFQRDAEPPLPEIEPSPGPAVQWEEFSEHDAHRYIQLITLTFDSV